MIEVRTTTDGVEPKLTIFVDGKNTDVGMYISDIDGLVRHNLLTHSYKILSTMLGRKGHSASPSVIEELFRPHI